MKKKKIINYAITFIIPVILLLIVFALLKIYPFGDKDLLWFDTQAQYIDFLSYWQNVIKGDASIFYSLSKNLGGNMYGIYTYYLTSPINLIIMLFSKVNLPQAFMLIILIKIGLCAVGFRYYLDNTKFITAESNNNNLKKLIFTTMYAMLSYNIVYCMSHMWLDCVALLPLIFLGVEKIIYEKKWGLYLVSFTVAIIANYYISFMIAIFSIPYFMYILMCKNKDKKFLTIIKENKDKIFVYIRISLISVLIAGIIVIPTLYALVSSKGKLYQSASLALYMYFDYFTLFAKNTLGSFSMNELRLGAPNIYAGLITLILTVMYFLNKKVEKKEKIYTGIFIFIFFICFYVNPINLFLHMLQSPMSFPFRYSFIFSFLTLIMGYKCINMIDDDNKKSLYIVIPILVFIFMIVDRNAYEYLVNWKVFITMFYVVIYGVYLSRIDKLRTMGHISLLLLIGSELVINGFLVMAWMPYGNRDVYRNHIEQYTKIYEYVDGIDNGLYRIAYNNRKSLDDSMMYDFAGLEHYSSMGEKATESFLNSMGYEGSPLVEYGKGTLLDNSILGVKYVLSTSTMDFYINKKVINDIFIYENPYALPLGYISSDKILEYNGNLTFDLPFEYQNYVYGLITGEEKEYYKPAEYELGEYSNLNITEYGDTLKLSIIDQTNSGYLDFKINIKDKPIYTYLAPQVRGGMVSYLVNGNEIETTQSNITYVGCSQEEITLRIVVYGEVDIKKEFIQYLDNEIAVESLMKLHQNSLEIIEHSDNYIKGKINTEKEELLLTTIPYEKGWTAYVNGKKQEKEELLATFMGIRLEKGENIVEFKYMSPGVDKGLILTIIGLMLLGLEIILIRIGKQSEHTTVSNIEEPIHQDVEDKEIDVVNDEKVKKSESKTKKNNSKTRKNNKRK